jgi:hypothetical protein
MRAHPKIFAAILAAVAVAVGFTACGTQGIQVANTSPYYHGARLFLERCSGCHTLAAVGAEGSATSVKDRVRTNGPNFDFRKEHPAEVLFAIHNGGFSGAIMPQNIVVGKDATEVALFLARYAGLQAPKVPSIENTALPSSPTTSTTATAPAGTKKTLIIVGAASLEKVSKGASTKGPTAKAAGTYTTASGK